MDENNFKVDSSYDIIDSNSARNSGEPPRNCNGSNWCIPKCFAEKGSRGLPGLTGLTGQKGVQGKYIINFFFQLTITIMTFKDTEFSI